MGIFLGTAKMENRNKKIESFFSNQLAELKAHYEQKKGGRVYVEPTRDKALERCLELADFAVCLDDIHFEIVNCNCDTEKWSYICVNPQNKFFFVVSICDCEQKRGNKK